MRILLALLFCLLAMSSMAQNVGVDVPAPLEKLDVAGRLRLSSDISVGAPTGGAGTLRWNATAGQFQGWNGSSWVSFASLVESDPVFSASPSFSITNTNITNWTTAFGWGDHASEGYLTSFTELDPQVSSATANLLSKWNGTTLVDGQIFDNATNVGIGTVSPGAKLEVAGQIKLTGGTPGLARVLRSDATGLATWVDPNTLVQGDDLGDHTATQNIELDGNWLNNDGLNGNGIRISDDGDVGIGIGSPVNVLHIHEHDGIHNPEGLRVTHGTFGATDSDGILLGLDNAGEARLWNHENSPLLLGTNNQERVRITSIGRVGIGTGAPAVNLHIQDNTGVNPTIRLSTSDLNSGGSITYLSGTPPTFRLSNSESSGSIEIDHAAGNKITLASDGDIDVTLPSSTGFNVGSFIALGEDGVTTTRNLRVTQGAAVDYVLKSSDVSGNAAWVDINTLVQGDDLGDHTATQNIELDGNWLSNSGGNSGIRIADNGNVGIGLATDATEMLEVVGNVKLTREADREITVAQEPSTSTAQPAKNLTVRAGNANFDNNSFAQRGGDLVLQAGRGYTNTVANSHGGHVILRSGANHLTSGSQKNGGDIILETGGSSNAVTERLRFSDTGVLTLPTINSSGNNRLLSISSAGVVSTSNIDPANVGTVTAVTASNGLASSGGTTPNITLGGSLTGATTIAQAANTLAFTSSATNGFSVDGTTFSVDAANNRIGIGTSGPLDELHVVGSIRMVDGNQGSGNIPVSDGNGTMTWTDPTALVTAEAWSLTGNSGTTPGTNFIGTTDNVGFRLRTNNTDRITVAADGNVGIGASPLTRLHVNGSQISSFTGSTRGIASIEGTYTNGHYAALDFLYTDGANPTARIAAQSNSFGSKLLFGTSNSYATGITNTAMTIDHTGNVGIGPTDPTAKLDVSGKIRGVATYAADESGTTGSTTSTSSSVFTGADLSATIALQNEDLVKVDCACNLSNSTGSTTYMRIMNSSGTGSWVQNSNWITSTGTNWSGGYSTGLFRATAAGNVTFQGYWHVGSGTGYYVYCNITAVVIGKYQ